MVSKSMARTRRRKLIPILDKKSTDSLNLAVLQRIDPFVEEILLTVSHVSFYDFNTDKGEWSRKNVEGSFFAVRRNAEPRFQFIVMNRLNDDNLVQNVSAVIEHDMQAPFIFYQTAQEVCGMWFYSAHECEEVANLFSRILNPSSELPTISKASATESTSPSSATANVPAYQSWANFFNCFRNIGTSTHVESHHFRPVVPNHSPGAVLPSLPSAQAPLLFPPITPFWRTTSLPGNLLRPIGSPLHHPPFPPVKPLSLLAPTYVPTPNYGPTITREKVREALQLLVQDDQFIDMFYQALQKAHGSR